jgi:hypothetical protein
MSLKTVGLFLSLGIATTSLTACGGSTPEAGKEAPPPAGGSAPSATPGTSTTPSEPATPAPAGEAEGGEGGEGS